MRRLALLVAVLACVAVIAQAISVQTLRSQAHARAQGQVHAKQLDEVDLAEFDDPQQTQEVEDALSDSNDVNQFDKPAEADNEAMNSMLPDPNDPLTQSKSSNDDDDPEEDEIKDQIEELKEQLKNKGKSSSSDKKGSNVKALPNLPPKPSPLPEFWIGKWCGWCYLRYHTDVDRADVAPFHHYKTWGFNEPPGKGRYIWVLVGGKPKRGLWSDLGYWKIHNDVKQHGHYGATPRNAWRHYVDSGHRHNLDIAITPA